MSEATSKRETLRLLLVASATVRLFLVLSVVLEWRTVSVDLASAFVHAPLKHPIWIYLLRGFPVKPRSKYLSTLKEVPVWISDRTATLVPALV
jgi:hypothetical protein